MKSTVIALSAGAALIFAGCAEKEAPKPPLVRSVRYVVVEKTDESGARTFSGALEAGNESQLSFQVAGRIDKLPIRAGQRVKSGQVVAELDDTDFDLQLREARANAAQAKAQRDNADANYSRVRRLYESRATSRQDLDAARAQRDTSRSAYVAAVEAVARIKRQLGYTRLVAPADGIVNAVLPEVNEVVSAGQPIAVLQAGDALKAAVDVPESFVRLLSLGAPAKVKVAAVKAEVDGVVQELGIAEQGTGLFPVMVKLSTDPKDARPGMVAEVVLTPPADAAVTPEGLRVPLTAVGEDRDGRFVFRVEGEPGSEGVVRRTAIETGKLTASGIYLTKGIEVGQRIVVAGVSRIKDGQTVRVPEKSAKEDGF